MGCRAPMALAPPGVRLIGDAHGLEEPRGDGSRASEALHDAGALLGRDVAALASLGIEPDAEHVAERDVDDLALPHGAAGVGGARASRIGHFAGRVYGAVRRVGDRIELSLLVAVHGRCVVEHKPHGFDETSDASLHGGEEASVIIGFERDVAREVVHGDDHGFDGGLHD